MQGSDFEESEAEEEESRSLIRWFRRRYPTPAERLAYARRAYRRWTATHGRTRPASNSARADHERQRPASGDILRLTSKEGDMAPRWTRWIVTVVLAVPGTALSFAEPARARIAPDAVIEAIAFEGIAMPERAEILDRIAVRVGDRLDGDARQRIGQRLNPPADARLFSYRDLTFTDRPGSRSGRVVLVVSLGC